MLPDLFGVAVLLVSWCFTRFVLFYLVFLGVGVAWLGFPWFHVGFVRISIVHAWFDLGLFGFVLPGLAFLSLTHAFWFLHRIRGVLQKVLLFSQVAWRGFFLA